MDGEKQSANVVLAWAAGLSATTAAVLLATKWWWRGERKSGGARGTSTRKALARSPGVRVVCVQVCLTSLTRIAAQDSSSIIGVQQNACGACQERRNDTYTILVHM